MRLYLTIHRNLLPTAELVWTIPEDRLRSPSYTISSLLRSVDEVVPLEADDWGLEDYAVYIGGFECLHFSRASETLKDGDHVHIAPLEAADIRSRTLSGRRQISSDGRLLVDGVPFGKPALRAIDRPRIHIPSRKRKRHTIEDADIERVRVGRSRDTVSLADADVDDESLLLLNGGEAKIADDATKPLSRRIRKCSKKVQFAVNSKEQLDDQDDSDDEDFEPDDMDASVIMTEDEIREAPNNAGFGGAHDHSPVYFSEEDATADDSDSTSVSSLSSSDSSTSELSSSCSSRLSDRSSENALDQEPSAGHLVTAGLSYDQQAKSAKAPSATAKSPTLAGLGLARTKARNQRRRLASKVRRLQKLAILGPNAGFEQLRSLKAAGGFPTQDQRESSSKSDEMRNKHHLAEAARVKGQRKGPYGDKQQQNIKSVPDKADTRLGRSSQVTQQNHQRDSDTGNAMMAKSYQGYTQTSTRKRKASGSKVNSNGGTKLEHTMVTKDALDHVNETASNTDTGSEPPSKRPRIDQKAVLRLVCGDMGVRVPRNAEEVEKVRKQLATRPKSSNIALRRPDRGNMTPTTSRERVTEPRVDAMVAMLTAEKVASNSTAANGFMKSTPESAAAKPTIINPVFKAAVEKGASNPAVENGPSKQTLKEATSKPTVDNLGMKPAVEDASQESARKDASVKSQSQNKSPEPNGEKPGAITNDMAQKPFSKHPTGEMLTTPTGELQAVTPIEENLYNKLSAEEKAEHLKNWAALHPEADDWKKKLTLIGVECIWFGQKLSTPPYPFFQRWDKQQKLRKRNRGHRNNPTEWERNGTRGYGPAFDDVDDSVVLDDAEEGERQVEQNVGVNLDAEVKQKPLNGAKPSCKGRRLKLDDLPFPPSDITSLPAATSQDLAPGSIIAFQQLELSEETRWSPEMSKHRTAKVIQYDEIRDELTFQFADRDIPRKQIKYNERGERIYGKFEVQMSDDDEDMEDDGIRVVNTFQMHNMRLVQAAPLAKKTSDGIATTEAAATVTETETTNDDEGPASAGAARQYGDTM